MGILLADGEGQVLRVNLAGQQLLGLAPGAAPGAAWTAVAPDGSQVDPDAHPARQALRTQGPVVVPELGVMRPDGEVVWISVHAAPAGPGQAILLCSDQSEAHRSRAILAARARLAEGAPGLSLEGLLRATLDEAEALTGSRIGFYHFMEADQVNLHLQAWSTRTEAEFCRAEGKGSHYPITQAGVWADCVRLGRPVIHNDYESLPGRRGLPPGHAEVVRELTVPVLRSGRIVAIVGVGNKPTPYGDGDVDSIQRLADLAWDLAEAKRAVEDLHERDLSFREVIQHSPLAMVVADRHDEDIRLMNRKFTDLFGYTLDDVHSVAQWWPRAYPDPAYREEVRQGWLARIERYEAGGGPFEPQDVTVTCKDGSTRYIRVELASMGGPHAVTFTDLTEHRRTEEVLGFLATCGSTPGEDFFQSLARFLARQLDMDFVCIDQLEGDGLSARTLAVWCDGRFEDNISYGLKDTPCADVVGKSVCCFPAGVAARFPEDKVLQDLRAESYVGVTLWDHTNQPIGLIAIIGRRPLADPAVGQSVLKLVAGRAAGELERLKAEVQLRASEEAFRRQFTDNFTMMLLVDFRTGRIVDANDAAVAFYGYPRERLLGLHISELNTLPPGEIQAAMDLVAGQRGARFEFQHRLADGTIRDVQVSSSRIRLGDREVLHSIIHDVTQRKVAERALKASEDRYRAQFNLASEGIFTLSPEGTLLEVNQAFARMHGYTVAELKGMKITDLDTPESAAFTPGRLRRLLAGESLTFEVEHFHKDGHRFPLEVSANLVAGGGRPSLLCFHRDITERKQAQEALRESAEQLRIIFEASDAGMILVLPTGIISFANRRMDELFGCPAQSLIGTPYAALLHDSERLQGDGKMRQLIRGEIQSVSLERHYVRADGTDFWGQLSGRRLEHPDGSLRALVGVITDISERKRMEREQLLIDQRIQQAQKMESLGSLAGGVAHDMNNVLGAILGLASAHFETEPEGSPAHRAFGTIIKAAERGGTMVKSLLNLARQSPAELMELDLNAILREEVRLLERTTLAKVDLVLDLAPGLQPIRGDASALTHALMNLCVNAVDAMPERGTLTLGTRNVDQDWIEVRVEDTGTGMPPDVLEKALDPFFTTKGVGKGTGLGLSIVYSTVKSHGGQMEILSQPGRGTCVKLRFPACAAAPAQEADEAPRLPAPQRSLGVLMVDDDELIQSSMQVILEALGHRVTPARSGEEALAQLEAGLAPDVVILDMNMPGMGGAGTLPRLRALRPELPVLLATGRADQTARDLVAAHPRVTLLSKPFGMAELQQNLEPLIRG
ncbi:MAG: sensor hybrid histidine kinase [Holophagaceae bacterium]|nr:sensor hybrid histidine kinase [Holophagaceae bacterium]